MNQRTRDAIEAVLAEEGGFVDHPADKGGPTNRGVTLRTLEEWRGVPVSAADVRAMELPEAIDIYEANYVRAPRLDDIKDDALFRYMVDSAVHHGPKRAIKMLQKVIGVTADGIAGPVTLSTVNRLRGDQVLAALRKERVVFMARIVERDVSQVIFLEGWLARAMA